MTAFLATQMDFIFFFYGLAFILLGAVCFTIGKEGSRDRWTTLGLFAVLHGGGEWLDLSALVIGETPVFAAVRTALMALSFLFLVEFARLQLIGFGLRVPGRWCYLALVLPIMVAGFVEGTATANALARYAFGLTGALGAGYAFARHGRTFTGRSRWLGQGMGAGFALYALAAGMIVPAAPFWPASHFNHGWFLATTGVPIQLIRGILATGLAFALWGIWGRILMEEVASDRYTAYLRRQFIALVAGISIVFVLGWALTQSLGEIYHENIQREAQGDVELIRSRIASATGDMDGMARVLAGSDAVVAALSGNGADSWRARGAVALHVSAAGAAEGYVVDRQGAVAAMSAIRHAPPGQTPIFRDAPYFRAAMAGRPGHYLAADAGGGEPHYYASHSVYHGGRVVGAAILRTSFAGLAANLQGFDRSYFLVDARGIVVLTNSSGQSSRRMWPIAAPGAGGAAGGVPLMTVVPPDGRWTMFDGERSFVRYGKLDNSDWWLVVVTPDAAVFANRVLGIIITLLVTMMVLIYLVAKEHGVRDTVQMEKRLKLQELAHELRSLATTDSLTGLSNRLRFDEALAAELQRAARYAVPFSLILYDIDHFKAINDAHGHQAGDDVLVALSRMVAQHIRASDLLARWGGEEFAILLPGADAAMARDAADKLRREIARAPIGPAGAVSCSFGVAEYGEGDMAATITARADAALYRAKLQGRNRVEVAPLPATPAPARAVA